MLNNWSKFLPKEIREWLFSPKIDGKKIKFLPDSFFDPKIADPRDRQMGWFLFGGYTPLNEETHWKPVSIKNQIPFNTCGWNAAVGVLEVLLGKKLSVRFLVAMGKLKGWVIRDGLSYTSNNQRTLKDFGTCDEELLPEGEHRDFNTYSRSEQLTPERQENAYQNRIKDFVWVSGRGEILKALDERKPIQVGGGWYSGWGAFIDRIAGVFLGGHAVYVLNYRKKGAEVQIINSWGENWGLNGTCWMTMDFFLRNYKGGYIEYPLDETALSAFLRNFEGADVKANNSPSIYRIQSGVKRAYPNSITYFAFGGRFGKNYTWQPVDKELLAKIIEGEPMDIRESENWDFLKDNWDFITKLSEPENFKAVQKLLSPPVGVWDKIKSYVKR